MLRIVLWIVRAFTLFCSVDKWYLFVLFTIWMRLSVIRFSHSDGRFAASHLFHHLIEMKLVEVILYFWLIACTNITIGMQRVIDYLNFWFVYLFLFITLLIIIYSVNLMHYSGVVVSVAWPCLNNSRQFGIAGLDIELIDILEPLMFHSNDINHLFVIDKRGSYFWH